jgi:signal transduction histidine kinase
VPFLNRRSIVAQVRGALGLLAVLMMLGSMGMLGLAIVQRLVAAHHGQIRAQSQLGFGSSFTVLLSC